MKISNLVKVFIASLFFLINYTLAGDIIKHTHNSSCSHASVPEPSTMLLLAAGIAGIAGYRKLKNRNKK